MTQAASLDARSFVRTTAATDSRGTQSRRRMVVPTAGEVASLALKRFEADQPIVNAAGNHSHTYRAAKRAMDIAGAVCGIVLLSPVLLLTLLILTVTTRGKAVFSQERIGYLGRRFRMYKFRTMRLDAEQIQSEVENEKDGPIFKNRRDPRVTRIGAILRRLSIDEMPQLFNVLLGDMALVGPRPPVAKEVVRYAPWQRQRLAVRPGLTCLWQVSGRSEVGFEDWVRMDIWYVNNQNLWTDLGLLVKTPLAVLSCRGAY